MKTKFEWKKEEEWGTDSILELSTRNGEFRFVSFDNEARMLIRWYPHTGNGKYEEIFLHYCNPKTEFLEMLKEFIQLTEEKFGQDWSKLGG